MFASVLVAVVVRAILPVGSRCCLTSALFHQVLMTYWDMDQIEVEDIMTEFLKKSLAQSEFDTTLDSYVYSIHDLQLDFIKNQLRSKDGKERVRTDNHSGKIVCPRVPDEVPWKTVSPAFNSAFRSYRICIVTSWRSTSRDTTPTATSRTTPTSSSTLATICTNRSNTTSSQKSTST